MVHPQLGAHRLRRPQVDVGVRRPRQDDPGQRHERQGLRRQQPSRRRVLRRVGVGVGRQRDEADGVVLSVQVDGGPGRRSPAERARIAQLVGGERLLREPGTHGVAYGHVAAGHADHQRKRLCGGLVELLLELLHRPLRDQRRQARRQQKRQEGSKRRQRAQVDRLDDLHVQEVLDHRRRTERAVVGERHRVIDARLHHERQAGREHRLRQVAKLVDTPAQNEPEPVEEDLVLQVGAELEAVGRVRTDGDVEGVAAHVAAVGQVVPLPHERRVADLRIEGLGLEPEIYRLPRVRVRQQEIRRSAVEEVREHLRPQVAPFIPQLGVAHVRPALDVERAHPGVHQPLGPGHAARVGDPAVRQILIHPHVELRLARAPVGEGATERTGAVIRIQRTAYRGARHPRIVDDRNAARRTREGIGPEVAGADAVGQPVGGRPRDRRVRAEHRPDALTHRRARFPVDPAAAHRHRRPHRLPRRLRDDVDRPGHGVGAPGRGRRPAHHLDLLDVALVGRQQVPHDQAEEVQVDAAAVHQHELRVGHRPGGLPAGDLDVARRELNHVDAGHRAEGVADVGARRRRQGLAGDDRRRYGRIHDPDLGARGGDDHRVAEARQRQDDRIQFDGRVGNDDALNRRIRKAGQGHRHGVGAGDEAGERVLPVAVRRGRTHSPGACQRDRRPRQHGAGFVDHAAGHPTGLRRGRNGPQRQ